MDIFLRQEILQYLTAGESHGEALMAILEGFPGGLRVDKEKKIRI